MRASSVSFLEGLIVVDSGLKDRRQSPSSQHVSQLLALTYQRLVIRVVRASHGAGLRGRSRSGRRMTCCLVVPEHVVINGV